MIIALLGKAGAGKTTVAKAMEKYVKDSFVIDGDELRAETSNRSIASAGREANMHLGYSRARRLADLGFTVFVAMQAPIKEIRDQYLNENDIEIVVSNIGDNPKDALGYNANFSPDYTGVTKSLVLQDFTPEGFYAHYFPKVLVPARFQGFHKGHKVVMEEAARLSPNVTIGLRVDGEDAIDLDKNIKMLKAKGYNTVKTPSIDEDWTTFANGYDIYVQGNPVVIKKFENAKCRHVFIPRYGDVSGTTTREMVGKSESVSYNIDPDVEKLIKENMR
jgi:nicotinamide mononucleotide adenylyltransferase